MTLANGYTSFTLTAESSWHVIHFHILHGNDKVSIHPSSWRHSPEWALASLTISLHCSLSSAFSVHCLIFIALKSATTSSIHLKRGLPSIIILVIAPASIPFTWPSHLILCTFINFTISFLFMNLFSSSLYEGWNFNNGNYLFTTDTK